MMKAVSKESFLELRKFTRFYASKYFLMAMLVLGVIVLLAPGFLRTTPFMIGDESFYHLRIAKDLVQNNFNLERDELSFSGRDNYMEKGLIYSIASISFVTKSSVEDSAKFLFLILGISFLLLAYLILKYFEMEEGLLTIPVLIFSPGFIYLFSVINKFTIPFVLSLLLFYLILKKKYFISGLVYLLIPLFSYNIAIFVFILIVLFFIRKYRFLLFAFMLILFSWLSTLEGFNLNLVSDFGNVYGLSIFGIFTILFGFGLFWKKKKFIKIYGICLLLALFTFKIYWGIFYLNVFFSLLIALTLIDLLKMNWESNLIRDLSVLLLVFGLLFSGVSTIKSLSENEPSNELFDALSRIPRGSVVASHSKNGHWITYSGMKNVVDDFTEVDDLSKRKEDLDVLFFGRDFSNSTKILDEYNVEYLLIDKKMKHEFWDNDDEGLLFLLKYSERFENVYDEETEIWRYI